MKQVVFPKIIKSKGIQSICNPFPMSGRTGMSVSLSYKMVECGRK